MLSRENAILNLGLVYKEREVTFAGKMEILYYSSDRNIMAMEY